MAWNVLEPDSAGDAMWIARILALVFVIMFIVSLVLGRGSPPVG